MVKLNSSNIALREERDRAEKNQLKADEEKVRAELMHTQAELQRKRADEEMYRAEDITKKVHQNKRLLAALMKDPNIRQIIMNTDNVAHYEPISALKKAMILLNDIDEVNQAYMWSEMQKGYVHLLRQELQSANQQFAINSINAQDLFSISRKYEKYARSGQLLPGDILGEFLVELMRAPYTFRRGCCVQILRYDAEKRQSPVEHSKAVFAFLKRINLRWKNQQIHYDPVKRKLSLHGKHLHKLSHEVGTFVPWGDNKNYRTSILYGLKLQELDVSGTSIKDFNELLGLKIKKVDIRHTNISDLSAVVKAKTLEALVVHKGQFTKEQLSVLPKQLKLTIK